MRIYGVDFTSAPRLRKPITCAVCELDGGALQVDCFAAFADFNLFENFLGSTGPWVAGLDFPFGQPRRLLEGVGWPLEWATYVKRVANLSPQAFEEVLKRYRDGHPRGQKQPLRTTDGLVGARSPMMVYGVPVGKMFYQGAPRLERSSVSILPCRPRPDQRVALETYPALVARRFIGRRSYKHDTRAKQSPERRQARCDLISGLYSATFRQTYGFLLGLPLALVETLTEDPKADELDALLCAIQAAWAYGARQSGYGIPPEADAAEGWIVDPGLAVNS